jgi:folylpolyglutamate synthase/dihydropteroate synthase
MEPYPESSEVICEIAKKNNLAVRDGKDLFESLKIISQENGDKALRILICGSLHLAQDVKYFAKMLAE